MCQLPTKTKNHSKNPTEPLVLVNSTLMVGPSGLTLLHCWRSIWKNNSITSKHFPRNSLLFCFYKLHMSSQNARLPPEPIMHHKAFPWDFMEMLGTYQGLSGCHHKIKCIVSQNEAEMLIPFHSKLLFWKTNTNRLRCWPKAQSLTCFPRHRLEPRREPQQQPREAHLESEPLLPLPPPGFAAPPPAQHHHHGSSPGEPRVVVLTPRRHPFDHHAGHGAAFLGQRSPAESPVVAQRRETVKRGGRRTRAAAAVRGP